MFSSHTRGMGRFVDVFGVSDAENIGYVSYLVNIATFIMLFVEISAVRS